ncbi:MAG: hypothetical protein IJC84_00930 [Clostridia bacterium]|nr:hypothetical protein [Clostridia bacterium]
MKKVLCLCLVLTLILLCSCRGENSNGGVTHCPLQGTWSAIIKNGERTDACSVHFDESGTVTLRYTDPNSVLFDMEEIADGQGVKVKFGEILSEKKGDSLPSTRLWRARALLESNAEETRENDKILLAAGSEGAQIRLLVTKEKKTPLSIEISDRYGDLSLCFERDGSDQS